jgi:hypothetical protein
MRMPRKTAGYKYPHVSSTAREHDHRMCAVIDAIARRAASGAEPWGTPHHMPPLGDESQAHRVRNRLFGGRSCPRLARVHGTLSVSVMYATDAGEYTNARTATGKGFVLVVRVFTRDAGQQAITERVASGQQLAYNPRKETF